MLEPFDRLVIRYIKVLNLTFKIIPEPVLSIESGHVVHVLGGRYVSRSMSRAKFLSDKFSVHLTTNGDVKLSTNVVHGRNGLRLISLTIKTPKKNITQIPPPS